MNKEHPRARWAAIGAAIAVTLGSGGLMTASAAVDDGERTVYIPITPCRVMDTRPAPDTVGPRATPLTATEVYSIPVLGSNGNCTIPADAAGLSLNVTIDNPTGDSYLTVYPADAARPTASNLNWTAQQAPVPNAVTTDVSADGRVSFYNNGGNVDVLADIVGYYTDHNHDDRYYTKAQTYSKDETYAKDETYSRTETYSKSETLSADEITSALDGKVDVPSGAGFLRAPVLTMVAGGTSVPYTVDPSGLVTVINPGCFYGQVLDLPDGATVTEVSGNVNDTGRGDAEVYLWRDAPGAVALEQVAVAVSVGGAGDQLVTTSDIAFPVVDRQGFEYFLGVCSTFSGEAFYDARVDFIYP